MKAIALLLAVFCTTEAANILVYFPVPSPSIAIIGNSVAIGLADQGHNVTIVTVLSTGKNVANLFEIIVPLPKEHKGLKVNKIRLNAILTV